MADVKRKPDDYPRVTPYLCVTDPEAAIAFYGEVFGATERMRIDGPGGSVVHAELQIREGLVMLGGEWPDAGALAPSTIGGTPVGINVYVDDVDATFAKALEHGAAETQPIADQFWGDRSGQFIDPFGHKWSVATHVEDVTPEEIARRANEMFGA